MKLERLELTNFRCFDTLSIDFDERLTVLVAPNGQGKSAVLDAISVALGAFLTALPEVKGINFKETDFRLFDDGEKPAYMRLAVTARDGMTWDRTEKRDRTAKTLREIPAAKGLKEIQRYAASLVTDFANGRNPRFPIVAYYGTGRGVFDVPKRRRGFKKNFVINDGYNGALEARANFKSFFEYFYFLEDIERREKEERRDWDYRRKELEVIREAIRRMIPGFSNPRTAVRPLRFVVDWIHGKEKQVLRIEQLSDGYRTSLAMVMDIAARLIALNLLHDDVLESEGIVLIDEVDLHLHPSWQQTVLPDLTRTFPNIQFIVSTHSPQVLTTVRREQIRVLGRARDGRFFAEPPLGKTYAEESNNVLQAVMGVNPVPPLRIRDVLEEYTALVEQGLYADPETVNKKQVLEAELGVDHPRLRCLERSIQRMEALNK